MGKDGGNIRTVRRRFRCKARATRAHVATGDVPFRMIIALRGRTYGGCVPVRDDVRRNAARESGWEEV